jgi:glutamyl-tRNA synthetase
MGLLPDAFINYLARLGWSFGDQEFFARNELIEKFTLENVGKSAGIFDPVKLQALNADHIQAAAPATIAAHLKPFLLKEAIDARDDDYLNALIPTLQPRSKTLVDMSMQSRFYFTDPVVLDETAAKKFLKGNVLDPLKELHKKLTELENYSEAGLESVFVALMEAYQIKLGKIAQPLRVALTGTSVSPGIFEIIMVLGRQRVLDRLQAAIRYIEKRVARET